MSGETKSARENVHGEMLDTLRPLLNWKIAHKDTAIFVYQQIDNKYFEPIAKPMCKVLVREVFPNVTPNVITALVDSICEEKARLFDDAIFQEQRRFIVGFRNKIFDLRTGKVRNYQKSDFVVNPLPYDIPVNCNPDIEKWFLKVLVDWTDPETGIWLADVLAYFLFIYPNHENLWLDTFGGGQNGKSIFLRLLTNIVGEEKVIGCDLKYIGRFSGDAYKDKWLVLGRDSASEVPDQAISFIKAYTGERQLHVERKGGAEFDTPNPGKIIVSTNDLIRSRDRSFGWYRRILPIPFLHRFPINAKFEDSVIKKTPDIARILLHRAFLIRKNETSIIGSCPPPVQILRNETRMLNDRIAAFWMLWFHDDVERMITDVNGYETTITVNELNHAKLESLHEKSITELYRIYADWHTEEFGEIAVEPSIKTFGGPYGAFLQSEAGEFFEYKRSGAKRMVLLKKASAVSQSSLQNQTLTVYEQEQLTRYGKIFYPQSQDGQKLFNKQKRGKI